jgi:hypothetical protein
METRGMPAAQLSDDDLERQGRQAHATRHWVFLHGTAEQFQRHTERMLELEQEYLHRHPKRTWQGTAGASAGADPVELDRKARLRQVLRGFTDEIEHLLGEDEAQAPVATEPGAAERELLARFAATEGGRLHKLEAHQLARELGVSPTATAVLYRHHPPLLATAGADRFITSAGRAWLESQPT